MAKILCTVLISVLFVANAAAQEQVAPSAPRTSVSVADFRRLALMGESFDLESSKLAVAKATRGSIRRYATGLINQFRLNYARLSAGAGLFANIPALPGDPEAAIAPFLDPRRQTMLNQLNTAQGRILDRLYVDMQLGMRQELIALYETYLQTGGDAQLMAFAQSRLPALMNEQRTIARLAGRSRMR